MILAHLPARRRCFNMQQQHRRLVQHSHVEELQQMDLFVYSHLLMREQRTRTAQERTALMGDRGVWRIPVMGLNRPPGDIVTVPVNAIPSFLIYSTVSWQYCLFSFIDQQTKTTANAGTKSPSYNTQTPIMMIVAVTAAVFASILLSVTFLIRLWCRRHHHDGKGRDSIEESLTFWDDDVKRSIQTTNIPPHLLILRQRIGEGYTHSRQLYPCTYLHAACYR